MKAKGKKKFNDLVKVVRILRSPKGCPWDRKQKLHNYKAYFLEETYELLESINKKDTAGIIEELGDLLLLIVMSAQIIKEKGKGNISKVISEITNKLIRRHPHVFGEVKVKNSAEVLKNWVKNKSKEKKRNNLSQRIPKIAPALLKANILFKELKYAHKKIVFSNKIIPSKNLTKKQIKDALFYLAYLAHKKGINLEEALEAEVRRFASKFKYETSKNKKGR